MAVMLNYLLTKQNLAQILAAIQKAHAPERFTVRFLEGLGFKSTNDRAIIGVLKGLGFLAESGAPTDRYVAFLDTDEAPYVLGDAIQESYSGLFEVRRDAENMTTAEVKNKIKTLMQGKVKDSVLAKMSMTFTALCSLAKFDRLPKSSTGNVTSTVESEVIEDRPTETSGKRQSLAKQKEATTDTGKSLDGLLMNYRIELVLPPSKDKAVYDALFASLKEHLLR